MRRERRVCEGAFADVHNQFIGVWRSAEKGSC